MVDPNIYIAFNFTFPLSGWLVLRSQKRETPSQLEAGEGPPVNTRIDYEWCDDADDWGTETNDE